VEPLLLVALGVTGYLLVAAGVSWVRRRTSSATRSGPTEAERADEQRAALHGEIQRLRRDLEQSRREDPDPPGDGPPPDRP
jgi:hypothetical protein